MDRAARDSRAVVEQWMDIRKYHLGTVTPARLLAGQPVRMTILCKRDQ